MIIAMFPMRMVKMTIHQVVNMVSMHYFWVTAVGPMHVSGAVAVALVSRRAVVRIGRRDLQHTFIHVIDMRVVQMSVMQIVSMTIMFNREMTTARTMLMRVPVNFRAASHNYLVIYLG